MSVQAKDLTKEFPRSPYDTSMADMPWLARVTDKVRALKAGTIGEYTPFPCGGDQRFMGTVGIAPEAFKAVVDGGADDATIAEWVKGNASEGYEARLGEYVKGMGEGYPEGSEMAGYLAGAIAELKAARPELDFTGVKNFGEMICVEEGYPTPVGAI